MLKTPPGSPTDVEAPESALVLAPRRPRGRPRKTEQERDDGNRRLALIRVAARLFRQQGYAGTSTRDIAQAAGMHSGSPFYHFKSKSALLCAVIEEGVRNAVVRQTEGLQALPVDDANPAARLRVLVRQHLDVLLGDDSDFVPVMLYEWQRLDPSQRAPIQHLKSAYEALWMPALLALQASGQLRASVGLARLMILGALNWSVQWYDPAGAATLDDLTDAALALFLKEPERSGSVKLEPNWA